VNAAGFTVRVAPFWHFDQPSWNLTRVVGARMSAAARGDTAAFVLWRARERALRVQEFSFDPLLHPRGRGGEFRDVLKAIDSGDPKRIAKATGRDEGQVRQGRERLARDLGVGVDQAPRFAERGGYWQKGSAAEFRGGGWAVGADGSSSKQGWVVRPASRMLPEGWVVYDPEGMFHSEWPSARAARVAVDGELRHPGEREVTAPYAGV
jgi:hypothetical protein